VVVQEAAFARETAVQRSTNPTAHIPPNRFRTARPRPDTRLPFWSFGRLTDAFPECLTPERVGGAAL